MDLNYILAWAIGIAAGAGLFAHGLRARFQFKGWVGVFLLVLLALGLGLWLAPAVAGYAAALVWGVLFLLPTLGARIVGRLVQQRRFAAAHGVARLLAVLHPFDGWRQQPMMLRILELVAADDLESLQSLAEQYAVETPIGRFALLSLLRADGRWQEICDWVEENADRQRLMADAQVGAIYLRALGEVGRVNTMLAVFARLMSSPAGLQGRQTFRLYVAALSGEVDTTRRLLDVAVRNGPTTVRDYWLATAEQAAGHGETADAIFRRLAASADPSLRRAAQRRLLTPLPAVHRGAMLESSFATLAQLERSLGEELRFGLLTGRRSRRAPVTLVFIAINLIAFAIEMPGGTTNGENLARLGALVVPFELVQGEWWRIFTAGFLHFGSLHLVLNVGGLWVFGRYVERVWGRGILVFSYLLATFGGNAIAWWVLATMYDAPGLAVGASGGVMGLLGAVLAVAAITWRRTGARLLKRQVLVFGGLLVLQTLFDVATPNVSTTIHLSGLMLGVLVGVLFAWRQPAAESGAEPAVVSARG